jgi:hypothetical protein
VDYFLVDRTGAQIVEIGTEHAERIRKFFGAS